MGHQHLGKLPKTRRWLQVIDLISGGADVRDVAAATSAAAEQQMTDASNDPGVRHSVWLLTQIPLAARTDDFGSRLRQLGLAVSDDATLLEISTAAMGAVDGYIAKAGGRSDLGEYASLSMVESLDAVVGRQIGDLFGASPAKTKSVLAGFATEAQFAVLARDFFSRLARHVLSYFLTRELSQHVGVGRRFRTLQDHQVFQEALDLHCRESSRIIKEFAGQWFSKQVFLGGINEDQAGRTARRLLVRQRQASSISAKQTLARPKRLAAMARNWPVLRKQAS